MLLYAAGFVFYLVDSGQSKKVNQLEDGTVLSRPKGFLFTRREIP